MVGVPVIVILTHWRSSSLLLWFNPPSSKLTPQCLALCCLLYGNSTSTHVPPSFLLSFLSRSYVKEIKSFKHAVSKIRKKLIAIKTGNFALFQQLRCKGSTDAYLPPWSGIDVANDENKDCQCQAEIGQQGVEGDGQTAFAIQNPNDESRQVNVNPEDLTYSNVEGQMHNTLPEHESEPETIYEISPQSSSPSKSSTPFKPLPYSLSKKKKEGQADGKEKSEGTSTKQVLA